MAPPLTRLWLTWGMPDKQNPTSDTTLYHFWDL
jgi:hypothetical protein